MSSARNDSTVSPTWMRSPLLSSIAFSSFSAFRYVWFFDPRSVTYHLPSFAATWKCRREAAGSLITICTLAGSRPATHGVSGLSSKVAPFSRPRSTIRFGNSVLRSASLSREEKAADAQVRRALLDGDLEVLTHAHAEVGRAKVTTAQRFVSQLPKAPEHGTRRGRAALQRGHRHQSPDVEAPGRARRGERVP